MSWDREKIDLLVSMKKASSTWQEIATATGFSPDACRKKYKRLKFNELTKPTFDFESPEMDFDEWLEEIEKMQELRLKASPAVKYAEVKIDTQMPIAFTAVSCIHLGGLYTYHRGFKNKINSILALDRYYMITLGDEWEGYPPNWAATVYENLIPPEYQRKLTELWVKSMIKKGKLLASVWSNHPAFIEKITGEDQTKDIFSGVPYFSSRGIMKLNVGVQEYIFDIAHDFKGQNPHKREFTGFPFADFVISGHRHQYSYQENDVNTRAFEAGLTSVSKTHWVSVGTAKVLGDPYTNRGWELPQFTFDTWPTFVLSAKSHRVAKVYDEEALRWYLLRSDF